MNSKRHGSPYILPLSAPINGPLYALLQRTGCSTTCCESRVTGVIPRQFLDLPFCKKVPNQILNHCSYFLLVCFQPGAKKRNIAHL